MKKLLVCFTLLSVLALSIGALAQVQNGSFAGTVEDPSGAAVPNAKVSITNLATNLSVVTTTNQTGNYSARELPPGSYKMVAEAPGFKTFTNNNVILNAGTNQRVDFKMTMGQAREVVEVQGEATQVSTEDSKLAYTVGTTQIANLPLNGRNVYDLIKLSPGAVDTRTVDLENDGSPGGAGTVVNGVRQDFNGFTINGVSNKALSGGAVNQPIEDTVQEFQQLTLNMSAQYGNSAGSITNLVTKSGTNDLHGSLFGFVRNDAFDAANYFVNQANAKKPPVRYNQIGGTLGGPIVKDKVFFFVAYQHDHFTTSNTPTPLNVESPDWRAAVAAANNGSVASVLYGNFVPSVIGTPASNCGDGTQLCDLTNYLTGVGASSAITDYTCPNSSLYTGGAALNTFPVSYQNQVVAAANKIGSVVGITSGESSTCGTVMTSSGSFSMPLFAGTIARSGVPIQFSTVSIFKSQQKGNLFNGHEASVRFDWDPSDKNRFFLQGNWLQTTDKFGPGLPQSARGFVNPTQNKYPNLQFSFIHTFNPKVLNEFRAGYLGNMLFQRAGIPGVPAIGMDDGTMGFGSYNGYPQFFKENIYSYSDMVSISHGNHNIKIGADIRRNIENSEFDVSRPSYYFTDQIAFTGDIPYGEAAGVDPHICASGPPCTTFNPAPASNLSTNIRHWRNIEFGAYFQDDWKATKRLTLNLGLRYDLYQRHHELNNLATTFLQGPGNLVIDNLQTGAGWLKSANAPFGSPGCPNTPFNVAASVEAGVCGPGGFAAAKSLGKGDHTDFGPRIGFAWDIFGDGKTSLRGGYGLSYEGTLYNPLSNSRWDPPYYSFNQAFGNFAQNGSSGIVYGPVTPSAAPTFTGPPDPLNHQGPGSNSVGNIMGWDPTNQNLAVLTGIVLPQGIKDPYVHNFFMSIQREILPRTVVELDYVGTAGHKLFRAQDINRIPGGRLTAGQCVFDNLGRQLCGQDDGNFNTTGRLNPNYGTLRNWQNVVNSNYNSFQAQLKMQSFHGVTMNIAYTFSHSIDEGSTWHSGATTANGHAAGEEFSLDQTMPQLDRGNSIYDIRNRLVVSYVWELPFFNHSSSGFLRNALGGWQLNGIWSYQTGPHWSPFCRSSAKRVFDPVTGFVIDNKGCDFNLDDGRNDRPNALAPNVDATHDMWASGWGSFYHLSGTAVTPGTTFFTRPCLGCVGSEGRNTFVGPKYFDVSPSLIKNFKFTERVGLQFRWEVFNAFNHTNFQLPGAQSSTHNRVNDPSFGQAGGAFDARIQQFGLKLMF